MLNFDLSILLYDENLQLQKRSRTLMQIDSVESVFTFKMFSTSRKRPKIPMDIIS